MPRRPACLGNPPPDILRQDKYVGLEQPHPAEAALVSVPVAVYSLPFAAETEAASAGVYPPAPAARAVIALAALAVLAAGPHPAFLGAPVLAAVVSVLVAAGAGKPARPPVLAWSWPPRE